MDITEKLRSYHSTSGYATTMHKAADTIDQLRAQLASQVAELSKTKLAYQELRAESERLKEKLNTEMLRTCDRCIEETAQRCAEIAIQNNDVLGARAIRKEFGIER